MSFRAMRRARQELDRGEAMALLAAGRTGVLALQGDGGYPYAVPINYVLVGETLYFHSAIEGHKIDAIERDPKASLCVIDADQVIPEAYTNAYRSVIVFGRASIVTDPEEKRAALIALGRKHSPDDEAGMQRMIEKGIDHLSMISLTIDHITGKEGLELLRRSR